MKTRFPLLSMALAAMFYPAQAEAAFLVSSYTLQGDLNSSISGTPALNAVDPLSQNGFESATVFGQSRLVYRFSGSGAFQNQAGLTLNTAGLIAGDSYSVEMVFQFTENSSYNGFRAILNSNGRSLEDALYVRPTNILNLFTFNAVEPGNNGTTAISDNTFYHLVATISPSGITSAYLNGALEATSTFGPLNIDAGNLLSFFLDNGEEYSRGRVALVNVYSGALSADEVSERFTNPFSASVNAVPAPSSFLLVLIGVSFLAFLPLRHRWHAMIIGRGAYPHTSPA